jgi:hypothetical protein
MPRRKSSKSKKGPKKLSTQNVKILLANLKKIFRVKSK